MKNSLISSSVILAGGLITTNSFQFINLSVDFPPNKNHCFASSWVPLLTLLYFSFVPASGSLNLYVTEERRPGEQQSLTLSRKGCLLTQLLMTQRKLECYPHSIYLSFQKAKSFHITTYRRVQPSSFKIIFFPNICHNIYRVQKCFYNSCV